MIAPKMPSRTLDICDVSTRIVPVQKAFSLITRRSTKTDGPRIQAKTFSVDSDKRVENHVREHGSAFVGDRRGMVSGRADGGLRGEPCTSTEPQLVCGAVEYRADEDHRSLFADDRPRGLFGHDRQPLSPNGSGHPHDLRGSYARWSATDDDRGHPRHQDDHGRQ